MIRSYFICYLIEAIINLTNRLRAAPLVRLEREYVFFDI